MVLIPKEVNQIPITGQAAKKVQGTAIVEGILEDQPTKVTVRGNDVVGLFFCPNL